MASEIHNTKNFVLFKIFQCFHDMISWVPVIPVPVVAVMTAIPCACAAVMTAIPCTCAAVMTDIPRACAAVIVSHNYRDMRDLFAFIQSSSRMVLNVMGWYGMLEKYIKRSFLVDWAITMIGHSW